MLCIRSPVTTRLVSIDFTVPDKGAPLGLILQIGGAEICLVRYGTPESLLENPHVLGH